MLDHQNYRCCKSDVLEDEGRRLSLPGALFISNFYHNLHDVLILNVQHGLIFFCVINGNQPVEERQTMLYVQNENVMLVMIKVGNKKKEKTQTTTN